MKQALITFCLLTMSSLLATNQSQEFQMGNEFAADLLNGGSAVKIDEILGVPNASPPEAGYREAELENKAQGLIKEGTASGMIVESSKSRERYKIDSSTDPIIQTSNQIAANPLNVIGGKDTKVVKINAPRETRTVTCEESGDPSQEVCKGRLNIKFVTQKKERTRTGRVTINFRYVEVVGRNYFFYVDVFDGHCRSLKEKLYRGTSRHDRSTILKADITSEFRHCAQNKESIINFPFQIDPKKIRKVTVLSGTIKKKMGELNSNTLFSTLNADFLIEVVDDYMEKVPGEDEWLWACDDLEKRADQGLCAYETENCTVGQQTRWIDGVQVTRPCWEKTRTYLCAYPAKNDCGPLRAQGCYQTKSTCKKWVGKACVVHTQTYQCDAGKNSGTIEAIQGGETPFCLDGNCTNQSWDSNDEMGNAMAQLSLLKQLQDDFKENKVSLFKGDDNRCKKETLGFKDCCKDKGWGQSMSLTSCSGDERALAEKKTKKLCHYVGMYCAKKTKLGICVEKKSTYCCYGTKLSRIFHEQGRIQIGLGWGDAQNPVCRGFTIEEIQKIDFSKLDLHEVFEEIVRNYTAPNLGVMKKQIEHRMQDIQNSIKPNMNLKNLPPQRKEA